MATMEDVARFVVAGQGSKAVKACELMIKQGAAPLDIINLGLITGMSEVGIKFKANEIFVPEVLMAAQAMRKGVDLVKPLINAADMPNLGRILIGTVKGDMHDIGKNLVGMMMEGAGFEVINAGLDVSPETFVEGVKEHKPAIIGMSALLTTTMLHMKDTIELLKEEGLRDSVKVIIGGAPVSQDFADEISADGYSPDAVSAAELCKRLLNVG